MNSHLERDNFIYISNFISPERAYELAKEFKFFVNHTNRVGDSQIEESNSAYDYVGFLELLCEKTPEVSGFLGETVLPTYSYARVYHNGAELKKHTDRPACEISLTLHLGGDAEWPISIKKPNGEEVSLNLKSGDAMMYLGCEAEHWRDQFKGTEFIQVFLHYVKSRGKNSFAYFDKSKNPTETTLNDSTGPFIAVNEPPKTENKITTHYPDISDYIAIFENLIPNELCDRILEEFRSSNEWMPTQVGQGEVHNNIRNADTINLSTAETISKNFNTRKTIDENIFEIAGNAIMKYNEKFHHARIEEDTGYELLRYREGQFYIEHTDSFKARPRAVSCSIALNDDYEGGEFAFFNRKIKHKLKKGSIIMFPSNFMFPHEIMEVTKGTRYSVITWFV
jgi:predicted 2-oxoglutarate/Fe(II)-dependent dioxygenase YbiX